MRESAVLAEAFECFAVEGFVDGHEGVQGSTFKVQSFHVRVFVVLAEAFEWLQV